eukprot:144276-Chlamydomonas_euryale.AAC.3
MVDAPAAAAVAAAVASVAAVAAAACRAASAPTAFPPPAGATASRPGAQLAAAPLPRPPQTASRHYAAGRSRLVLLMHRHPGGSKRVGCPQNRHLLQP